MTNCPKCGSPWRRQYKNEDLEGVELDERTAFRLMKQVICTNQPCSWAWELSPLEILINFAEGRTK